MFRLFEYFVEEVSLPCFLEILLTDLQLLENKRWLVQLDM